MASDLIQNLFDFIKKSPSPFHAVKNISEILTENGFMSLREDEKWTLRSGGKYFVTRNSSSVIAFSVPDSLTGTIPPRGFSICASHSDSPSFKIKENPEIPSCGSLVLNVEKYGGMLINPWFDRPLSVSGRVFASEKSEKGGRLKEILVNIDRNLLMIPNLAIHMMRDANNGHEIDVQSEIRPVFSMNQDENLLSVVAEEAGILEKEIVSHDLFLYNRSEPCVWGAKNEFISSPKLDDLECAFTTLLGFLESFQNNDAERDSIPVFCVFDNEEVGSKTRQGADSSFLSDVLERISEKLNWSGEDFKIALSKSFMVSADNAHAVHPNYSHFADPVNAPRINGGIVIKYNASQKYTSDAFSSAVFKEICKKAGVPFQIYTNNSNVAGGSTLGNLSQSHVSVPCVDVGLPQWAMHSPYESAGAKDAEHMVSAIREFYFPKPDGSISDRL